MEYASRPLCLQIKFTFRVLVSVHLKARILDPCVYLCGDVNILILTTFPLTTCVT